MWGTFFFIFFHRKLRNRCKSSTRSSRAPSVPSPQPVSRPLPVSLSLFPGRLPCPLGFPGPSESRLETSCLFSTKYFRVYFSGARTFSSITTARLSNPGNVTPSPNPGLSQLPLAHPVPAGFPPESQMLMRDHISLCSFRQNSSLVFLCIFLTLTFLKSTGQLLWSVSFNLGLSGVPSRLDSGCVFGEDTANGGHPFWASRVGLSPSWGC